MNTKEQLNKSEMNDQGKQNFSQTQIAPQNGTTVNDTTGAATAHENSKMKFFTQQFDKQQFYKGTKAEFKQLFDTDFAKPTDVQKALALEAAKANLEKDQKEDDLMHSQNEELLEKIDIIPVVEPELLGKKQLEKIYKKQSKNPSIADVIENFRMQQYIKRFNKETDDEEKKEEDEIDVQDKEEAAGQTEFTVTFDNVRGRAKSLSGKVFGQNKEELKKEDGGEELDELKDEIGDTGINTSQIKDKVDAVKTRIQTNVLPAPALAKQKTLDAFKCYTKQHADVVKDLKFGDEMNQGQLSEIIRWGKDNFMIQKVFDMDGDLHLQIMKIPYMNVHFTPNFKTKVSFQLSSSEGGDPDFKDQGANPEGRVWIQYNQYIYFYTVHNTWNATNSEENTYQLTRKCFNLETSKLVKDQEKVFDAMVEEDLDFRYGFHDRPVPDGTKVFGARCVIFSTPMQAPQMDDKGLVIKQPQDLIQDNPRDDTTRDNWLDSHYILVQSACQTTSREKFHTGRIRQQDKFLTLLTDIVAFKPRSSISFNLCHWTKSSIHSNAKDKITLTEKALGVLSVVQNDSGEAVVIDTFEIFNKIGISTKKKPPKKNQSKSKEQVEIQQITQQRVELSKINWEQEIRLTNQAQEAFDGQYQKVYTKLTLPGKDELSVEMMSTRNDPFKYRMAARIKVLEKNGCLNYRNNIIMIYHKDFNYYQVLANQDGQTHFSSVISNNTEDNFIPHVPFNPANCTFIQKLHSLYGEGFKQFSPYFINILITNDGKIVYLNEDGDVIHDSIKVDIEKDELNKTLHKYKVKHSHGKEVERKQKKNQESEFHLEINDQRRFQPEHDDRTVWVGIKYVGNNNQFVYLQVIQDQIVILNRIGSFDFKGSSDRRMHTSLCPSSAIQRRSDEKGDQNLFTQTYSLALMSKSKLYVEIMEYKLDWVEHETATPENTSFTQIGRKLLILNKPYYSKKGILKLQDTPMNFFPHYANNDRPDYFIDGTNLFANQDDQNWNIVIPTFKKDDYQFDGQLCNTGYKKFFEMVDSEDGKTKVVQERAILIDTRLSTALISAQEPVLKPSQRNLIFEQQIRTILNMWPKKDIIYSIQSYYTEENLDPLAGLEVVNCNCLADFIINQPNLLDKVINLSDSQKSNMKTLSFIEQFGREQMQETEYDQKAKKDVVLNHYEVLCKAFPQELEWIRKPFCVTDDLLMSNPLLKCFVEEMDQTIASVKILIENVFKSGRSTVSYNRMIQILPYILDPNNKQYGFEEYGCFFSDYGEDGAMDNLTFAIKLVHEDLPKFSDKEAFMQQFELKRNKIDKDEPDLYYPNTDLREKAMEQIKDLDRKAPEKKKRFPKLRQLFPSCFKELKDLEDTLGELEEEDAVKSIPVEHFFCNLNFLDASKLINSLFNNEVKIDLVTGELLSSLTVEEQEKKDKEGVPIQLKEGTGVSELQFVRMIQDINIKYKNGINEQQALQDVIDYIFYEKTEQFVQTKATAYILLFVIPYLAQLIFPMSHYAVIGLCIVAEFWKLFEAYYEYIQFSVEGFTTYIQDVSNIFDFTSFVSYNIYFAIRFFKTGTQFVGMNSQLDIDFWTSLNIFLNILIVTNIIIQLLQYMQVKEKFGLLVQLVNQCLADIKEFMCFFLIWILFFGLMTKALGSDNDLGAYPNIDIYFQIMIQTWQNSIGNINPPSTTYWNNHQASKDAQVAQYANIAVYTIYMFWFANQFLILIVLINFLIAVISQSYENVMDTAVIIKYSQRCDLNSQISLVFQHQGVLRKNYDCVILSSNTSHGGDNEWSGFCQSVKGFVKEQNAKVFNNIQKANDQLTTTKDKVISDIRGARKNVKTNVAEVEKLLNDLKQKIRDHPDARIEVNQSMVEQSQVADE